MRLVFISDTHNQLDRMVIPSGDILIHSGDATNRGTLQEIIKLNNDLKELPHKHKIFVPGNHDWGFQRDPFNSINLLSEAHVLIDQLIEIEGLKIYGSPWQPQFCNWAFNLQRGTELARKWEGIPHGLDILVTHGPPWGILDFVYNQTICGKIKHLGCKDLHNRIQKVKPRIHSFGHIHDSYGVKELIWDDSQKTTTFINASNCNEQYNPDNAPIVIDV